MRGALPILISLCVVVAAPFLFRQPEIDTGSAEDELVIISPHNEAIRFEFTRAFANYYRKSTGRSVHIDWRLPGGTTEIVRYLNSEFEASFRSYWIGDLRRPWDREVLEAFANPSVHGEVDRGSQSERARYAFLH
jgi:iron(III) transport system substrate-binding protein